MIGIEKRCKPASFMRRRVHQLFIGEVLPGSGPASPAGLEEPEAADVLQQADGSAHAAFVRKIQVARLRRDDGRGNLRSEQGPCPGTQEGAFAGGGYRRDGGSRVVARRRNHRRAGMRGRNGAL